MDRCRVCESEDSQILARREEVPVFQNGLPRTVQDAEAAATGSLKMMRCRHCGFVWNAAFDPELVIYDSTYDNAQHHSDAFRRHLADRVEDIVQAIGDGTVEILEIGCGQGDFLRDLLLRLGDDRVSRASGFDPAFAGTNDGVAELYPERFDQGTAARHGIAPDIVIIRHMIEHVSGPLPFFAELASALPRDKPVRLFVETPDVDWIIAHQSVFDLYYEHCSKFSSAALAIALRKNGFVLDRLTSTFGGHYLWARAYLDAVEPADAFLDGERAFVDKWRSITARANRPVFLWGAGAKGTTFALFVDPERRILDGVVDINPAKQGLFVPRTAHPIVAPETFKQANPRTVVIMNGNYAEEIKRMIAAMDLHPDVIVVDDG